MIIAIYANKDALKSGKYELVEIINSPEAVEYLKKIIVQEASFSETLKDIFREQLYFGR